MTKTYTDDLVLKFAESFAGCISDFTVAREEFMAGLPPDQQKLFRHEFNRLKRPELASQGPLENDQLKNSLF